MYTYQNDKTTIKRSKPSIFSYIDPVKYLFDYFNYRKDIDFNFSYEQWAKESGTQTRSHMRLVSLGKRAITNDFIQEYCTYNNFSDDEKRHFYLIKLYSESQQKNIKDSLLSTLLEKHCINHQEISESVYKVFLSHPLNGVLQTLFSYKDYQYTLNHLIHFLPKKHTHEIQHSINQLISIDFIEEKKNISNEAYWVSKIGPFKVKDGNKDSKTSNYLGEFHYKNLVQAAEIALDPNADSRCRSILIPVSTHQQCDLKNDIEDFLNKLKAKYGSDEIMNKKLFKINLHSFAETEITVDKTND